MESLVPGARVEAKQRCRCEAVGKLFFAVVGNSSVTRSAVGARNMQGRTESTWSVPLGWVEFAGFTVCVFCLRGVLYQIHVHRLDLLPEINPLVSCRARFSFCPACAPPPTDQSLQSDYEMNGSGLFSL